MVKSVHLVPNSGAPVVLSRPQSLHLSPMDVRGPGTVSARVKGQNVFHFHMVGQREVCKRSLYSAAGVCLDSPKGQPLL